MLKLNLPILGLVAVLSTVFAGAAFAQTPPGPPPPRWWQSCQLNQNNQPNCPGDPNGQWWQYCQFTPGATNCPSIPTGQPWWQFCQQNPTSSNCPTFANSQQPPPPPPPPPVSGLQSCMTNTLLNCSGATYFWPSLDTTIPDTQTCYGEGTTAGLYSCSSGAGGYYESSTPCSTTGLYYCSNGAGGYYESSTPCTTTASGYQLCSINGSLIEVPTYETCSALYGTAG